MQFVLKFSTITGKSSIHAPGCSNATKRKGSVVAKIEAESAAAAAKKADREGELTERGYPKPVVCDCAKPSRGDEGPKALTDLLRF